MTIIIKGVLKDELERSISLQEKYEQKLNEYPLGYLLKRQSLGRRTYYYLSYRENGKVKQKYLGRLSLEEEENIKQKIREKSEIQKQLAEVKKNIQYLEKLLKS